MRQKYCETKLQTFYTVQICTVTLYHHINFKIN